MTVIRSGGSQGMLHPDGRIVGGQQGFLNEDVLYGVNPRSSLEPYEFQSKSEH